MTEGGGTGVVLGPVLGVLLVVVAVGSIIGLKSRQTLGNKHKKHEPGWGRIAPVQTSSTSLNVSDYKNEKGLDVVKQKSIKSKKSLRNKDNNPEQKITSDKEVESSLHGSSRRKSTRQDKKDTTQQPSLESMKDDENAQDSKTEPFKRTSKILGKDQLVLGATDEKGRNSNEEESKEHDRLDRVSHSGKINSVRNYDIKKSVREIKTEQERCNADHIVLKKDSNLKTKASEITKNTQALEDEYQRLVEHVKENIKKKSSIAKIEENTRHNRYKDIGKY